MTAVLYSPEAFDDVQEILAFLQQQHQPELVEKFEADYLKALKGNSRLPARLAQAWQTDSRQDHKQAVPLRDLLRVL